MSSIKHAPKKTEGARGGGRPISGAPDWWKAERRANPVEGETGTDDELFPHVAYSSSQFDLVKKLYPAFAANFQAMSNWSDEQWAAERRRLSQSASKGQLRRWENAVDDPDDDELLQLADEQ